MLPCYRQTTTIPSDKAAMLNLVSTLCRLCAFAVFFGSAVAGSLGAQSVSATPGPWLLQSLHLSGNPADGFEKTCLLVYQNGAFHREDRRQYSSGGRAEVEWKAPEVFEGKLTEDGLQALETILQDPGFVDVHGSVGSGRDLWSRVVVNRQGEVIPHDVIEMMTVAVARSGAPQVFELSDFDVARKQTTLAAFLKWIKIAEHDKTQTSTAAQSDNCSPRIPMDHGTRKEPLIVGMTFPKAIYAPIPHVPPNRPKPKPVAVELLINPDGSVAQITLQGHPDEQIAQSIRETVSKWKFEPARLLGVPIAKTFLLTIDFKSN